MKKLKENKKLKKKYLPIFFGSILLLFFYFFLKNKNDLKQSVPYQKKIKSSKININTGCNLQKCVKIKKKKYDISNNLLQGPIRVIPQPGDGSCLFHSLAYGLGYSTNAKDLRKEICSFIKTNEHIKMSDVPLKEWIKWDSGKTVDKYAEKMAVSGWGGAIEMAAFSKMKNVNVQVFEECNRDYKLISEFKEPTSLKTIRVLYRGKNHYDAIDKH